MSFPDYPFTGRFAAIRGFNMHYLDEGPSDAPVLVMLHGNPSWSFLFRRLVLALRDRYRCIVPDHLGMGLSDKPIDAGYGFTLTERSEDIDTLLNQCGVTGDVTLVLHDWGGMIGLNWARRCPDRVRRLVIMNTAAFALPADCRLPWQLRTARLPIIGALLVRGLNLFCRGAAEQCVVRAPLPAEVRRAFLAPYDNWRNRLAVLRFVQDIPLHERDASWAEMQRAEQGLAQLADRPVLLCWGLRDFVFDRCFLDEWLRRFPEADVCAIDDAGHYLLEDAPDQLVPRISAFLDAQ